MEAILEKPTTTKQFHVLSPASNEIISTIDINSKADLDRAVQLAETAQKSWAKLTVKDRIEIFYTYRTKLQENKLELAELISLENGKILPEALAEVEKSIELMEFTCSLPQTIGGDTLEVSKGVECKTIKSPMGTVACITPFNFPLMVPHWSVPNALATGNAVILKPSEKTPLSAIKMKELLEEAGLPKNLLHILNGAKEMVTSICEHPNIKAVSFVGSTKVAKTVYQLATSYNKKALALGGAKNHLVVLPDAHPEMAASNVLASMTGCAGQRCMAASVMIGVGGIQHIVDLMVKKAKTMKCGTDIGAIIDHESTERIINLITQAEKEGATILVDGRHASTQRNFLGPTILDNITPDMSIAHNEVFGPVLSIIRTTTTDEAVKIQNNCLYGNGASVFTQSGAWANFFITNLSAGMVGVNVGVPVPREPFGFGGWNESKFGTGDITGNNSIPLWTQEKKVTTKWNPEDKTNWMN